MRTRSLRRMAFIAHTRAICWPLSGVRTQAHRPPVRVPAPGPGRAAESRSYLILGLFFFPKASPKRRHSLVPPLRLPLAPGTAFFCCFQQNKLKFSKLPSVYMVKNQLLLNSAHQHGTSHPFRCSCLFELRLPPWGRSSEQGDAALRELTGEMLIVVTVLQNDENRHLPSVSLCQVRHNSVVSLLWS